MDIIRASALHLMRKSRTSEKAKRTCVRGVVAYHKSEGRVGEWFIFQVWITRRIPWQREAATGVQASIYVCKICSERRRTCRCPWDARRPIKTRRAGRAPRKSGAAVTTIKWPRTKIDIGISALHSHRSATPCSEPPRPLPAGIWSARAWHIVVEYILWRTVYRIPYTFLAAAFIIYTL